MVLFTIPVSLLADQKLNSIWAGGKKLQKKNNPPTQKTAVTYNYEISECKAVLIPCRRIHRGQEEDGCFPAKVQLPLKRKGEKGEKLNFKAATGESILQQGSIFLGGIKAHF